MKSETIHQEMRRKFSLPNPFDRDALKMYRVTLTLTSRSGGHSIDTDVCELSPERAYNRARYIRSEYRIDESAGYSIERI
ncbi:MAG: hypothetical protein WC322_03380 [Candidatus Paceibacterota bacterium]|jgi:hypothetical protein